MFEEEFKKSQNSLKIISYMMYGNNYSYTEICLKTFIIFTGVLSSITTTLYIKGWKKNIIPII